MRRNHAAWLVLALAATPAAAADDYKWVLNQSSDLVELSYVIPDSDAIDLILSCRPGSKEISYVDVETTEKLANKKKATAILRVGGKPFTLKGKLSPNEEAGTPTFEASRPVKDGLWSALARAKDFETEMAGETESHSLEGANIAKFLKACGG